MTKEECIRTVMSRFASKNWNSQIEEAVRQGYNLGFKEGQKQAIDPIVVTIERGDEVMAWDTCDFVRFIAWCVDGDEVHGISENGGDYLYPVSVCHKTGRHFSITFADDE